MFSGEPKIVLFYRGLLFGKIECWVKRFFACKLFLTCKCVDRSIGQHVMLLKA